MRNTLTGNDVGVWIFNSDNCINGPTTATNNVVKFNAIANDIVNNTTGFSPDPTPCGYQARIADNGMKDLIVNNAISGFGYTPQSGDCPFLRFLRLDVEESRRAQQQVTAKHNTPPPPTGVQRPSWFHPDRVLERELRFRLL